MNEEAQEPRTDGIAGRAFLLRVWRTERDSRLRAAATDVDSGQTRVFVDLEDLTEWLGRCTE